MAPKSNAKIWFPSQFFAGLIGSLLIGVKRVVVNAVLRRLWWPLVGFPMYSRRGMTPASLTKYFRRNCGLQTTNSVTELDWVSLETGAIGVVFRVLITYAATVPSSLPGRAIVKMGGSKPSHILMNSIADFLVKEYQIYTILGNAPEEGPDHDGRLADLMPKIYYIGYGSSSASLLLLMEDLGHLRASKSRIGATVAEAEMMLAVVCKLHGRTWDDVSLFNRFRWPTRSRCFLYSLPMQVERLLSNALFAEEMAMQPLRSNLERLCDFGAVNNAVLTIRGFELGSKTLAYRSPCVLCHGDLRLDNAFFDDGAKQCRMIDWQICSFSHPIVEIVMLLLELKSELVVKSPGLVRHLLTKYVEGVLRELRSPSLSARVPTVEELQTLLPTALFHASVGWVLASAAASSNPVVMGPLLKGYFKRLNVLLELFPTLENTVS